jgi:hypothetical protein
MITKADVIAKFQQLHKKHYNQSGAYMISNVPDETSEKVFAGAHWHEVYNRYASDRFCIRSSNATVPLMGHEFQMQFHRPLVMEHRYEFESYFGFGGHCKGFNANRTIACFPKKIDEDADIDEMLLKDQCGTDPVDAEYAKQAIMLLAVGGYVKYWNAVHEFENWFADVAGIPECKGFNDSKQLMERIFDVMTLETVVVETTP